MDALRSVTISQQLLGTREIYVLHHTACGAWGWEWAAIEVPHSTAWGRAH